MHDHRAAGPSTSVTNPLAELRAWLEARVDAEAAERDAAIDRGRKSDGAWHDARAHAYSSVLAKLDEVSR